MKLVWMSMRGDFCKGGNVPLFMSGFLILSQRATKTRNLTPPSRAMKTRKKRHYNQRVTEVEHGSSSPLVSASYWGSGREAERSLAQLALKLSEKKRLEYSNVTNWLRAKLSFNLSGSALLVYVRGLNSFLFYMGIIFTSQAVFCEP